MFKKRRESEPRPTESKKRKILVLLLLLLILVLCGTLIADVGGMKSTALEQIWLYAVEHDYVDLARVCQQYGENFTGKANAYLQKAVRSNKPDRVRTLLALQADPNIIIDKGFPALYWCAIKDLPVVADYLVQAGANLEYRTRRGWSPLSAAVKKRYNRVALLLIDFGADIRTDKNNIELSPLWLAVKNGNIEILDRLLFMGIDTRVEIPSKVPKRRPFSVFDRALLSKQYEAAKRLLFATGPSRLTDTQVEGQPFISNGCLAVIQRELTRRNYADVSRSDINPIIDAIERNLSDEDIFSLIAQYPDRLDRPDLTGDTPLMTAVDRNRKRVVEHLIEKGCNVDQPDGNGYSPILLAADNGNLEIFRALVRAGADLMVTGCPSDDNLFTFLIIRNSIPMVRILLEENVDLSMSDPMGTPLQVAFSYGREDIAQILLDAGADPHIKSGHLFSGAEYIEREKRFARFKKYVNKKETGNNKHSLLKDEGETGSKKHWLLKDATETGEKRLHVITVYEGPQSRDDRFGRIPVVVSDTTKPAVLLFNSYKPIEWQVRVKPGVTLEKIYGLGYYEPRVTGVDMKVPIYIPEKKVRRKFRIRSVDNKDEFLNLLEAAEQMTGLRPATVQSAYAGSRFDVDGKTTMDYEHNTLDRPPDSPVVLVSGNFGGASVSPNGLSCTYGRAGAYSTAKANTGYNAGKWYYEMIINPDRKEPPPGTFTNVGLLSLDAENAHFSARPGGDYGYNYKLPVDLNSGDVVSVAANLTMGRLYFGVNGQWQNLNPKDPDSGLEIKKGRGYVAGASVSSTSGGRRDQITFNFGASPFFYPIPKGYRSYDGSQKGD